MLLRLHCVGRHSAAAWTMHSAPALHFSTVSWPEGCGGPVQPPTTDTSQPRALPRRSTVAALLAQVLGAAFYEGDAFHPPVNIAKMTVRMAGCLGAVALYSVAAMHSQQWKI